MIHLLRAVLLVLLCASMPGQAVIETYDFSSGELEERYQQLSAELRCPKCQNQNIADSNAPIAQDLRRLLYQQLEEGSSDAQILDHMVARYGEFVRYRDGLYSRLFQTPHNHHQISIGIAEPFLADDGAIRIQLRDHFDCSFG